MAPLSLVLGSIAAVLFHVEAAPLSALRGPLFTRKQAYND